MTNTIAEAEGFAKIDRLIVENDVSPAVLELVDEVRERCSYFDALNDALKGFLNTGYSDTVEAGIHTAIGIVEDRARRACDDMQAMITTD